MGAPNIRNFLVGNANVLYPPHRCDSEFPGDSMDTSVITLVGFSPVVM